jgi:hypothetical protein
MWTVFGMRSQDTIANPDRHFSRDTRSVSFPFWMAREIAVDLEEKSLLKAREELLLLEIGTWKLLVGGLEQEKATMELQLELLQKNQQLLQSQLKAARSTRQTAKDLKWVLRMTAALGVGYILGNLNH